MNPSIAILGKIFSEFLLYGLYAPKHYISSLKIKRCSYFDSLVFKIDRELFHLTATYTKIAKDTLNLP